VCCCRAAPRSLACSRHSRPASGPPAQSHRLRPRRHVEARGSARSGTTRIGGGPSPEESLPAAQAPTLSASGGEFNALAPNRGLACRRREARTKWVRATYEATSPVRDTLVGCAVPARQKLTWVSAGVPSGERWECARDCRRTPPERSGSHTRQPWRACIRGPAITRRDKIQKGGRRVEGRSAAPTKAHAVRPESAPPPTPFVLIGDAASLTPY